MGLSAPHISSFFHEKHQAIRMANHGRNYLRVYHLFDGDFDYVSYFGSYSLRQWTHNPIDQQQVLLTLTVTYHLYPPIS